MTKDEKKKRDQQIAVAVIGVLVIYRLRKDVKNLKRDVRILHNSSTEIIKYLNTTHDTIYKTATMAQSLAAVK